jgi:EPS-associated MarR family transcriptional regulator
MPTPTPSRRSQLQEDTYFRVLRMLQDNPDMTQREIAERLGVSTSGMNYCLNALIDKGWVKVHNFSQSKNKFGYIYVLTPQGIVEKMTLASRFLMRKQAEYEALRAEIDGLTEELSDDLITHQLKATRNNQQTAEALIESAKLRGGRDNITVVIVSNELNPNN